MNTDKRTLTVEDYEKAARALACDLPAVRAVVEVESAGGGYLPDGRPKILFEGHWFSSYTGRRFDLSHPTISYKRWTRAHYKGGAAEYSRFDLALKLDRRAALMSTSFGLFQIMGFNYKLAGYTDVESFYRAMCESAGNQLIAFIKFIEAKGLDDELREHRWAAFAYQYNGESYRSNKYDIRLAAAHKRFGGV
jgi:hypothetical protein